MEDGLVGLVGELDVVEDDVAANGIVDGVEPVGARGVGEFVALGEELLRQFLKSLSPQQMDAIVGSLKPEQAAVINEIYLAYGERELATEKAKKNGKNRIEVFGEGPVPQS